MENLTTTQIGLVNLFCIAAVMFAITFMRRRKKTHTHEAIFSPRESFGTKIKNLFFSGDRPITEIQTELEEILLTADAGVHITERLIKKIFSEHKPQNAPEAHALLKNEIKALFTPETDFKINVSQKPFVIYLVGVNGVGKTTTTGKLAAQFKRDGSRVMMVAADTFRAAAVEQLRLWGELNDVLFHGGPGHADPSSVIVDGLNAAVAREADIVLVDTAGRLHTKTNLMEELKKMSRMCEKVLNHPPNEIFLVIDAITGQNGFHQAKIFLDAVPVTGVVLTKYDATAKGGIILSIVSETGLPVRYVGLGEKVDDLKKFTAEAFVEKMLGA